MENNKIYYARLSWMGETMLLAATDKGLSWAGGFTEDFHVMETWLKKKNAQTELEENEAKLLPYLEAFREYFSGKRNTLEIPLDLQGTPFQLGVWKALMDIPFGETKTYSDIAVHIGNPKSIRAVGTAIGRNPVLVAVPCHRVIQKNGSLGGFRAGLPLKKRLLELEQTGIWTQ